jgi:hypothetical protein
VIEDPTFFQLCHQACVPRSEISVTIDARYIKCAVKKPDREDSLIWSLVERVWYLQGVEQNLTFESPFPRHSQWRMASSACEDLNKRHSHSVLRLYARTL